MIRQIKCICLLFALVFPALRLAAQDQDVPEQERYLDSIQKVLANDYARQLNRYYELAEQQAASSRAEIDSLENIIVAMDRVMQTLSRSNSEFRSDLESLRLEMKQQKEVVISEKERFTRLLLITGPSLLVLILLSTVLFFLLIRRQQESTDRKISALKKYTYTEIEETRTDLAQQFRKRVKKLRDKLNGKGGKKGKESTISGKKTEKKKSKRK